MSQGGDGHSPAPDGSEQAVILVRAVVSTFTGKDVKSLEKALNDFGCQEFVKHLIFDFIRSESQNYERSLRKGDPESFDPIQGLVAGLRALASSLQGNARMAVHIGQLVFVANRLESLTMSNQGDSPTFHGPVQANQIGSGNSSENTQLQQNNQVYQGIDLHELVEALGALHDHLRPRATNEAEVEQADEVLAARSAASANDGPRVWRHLRRLGGSVLSTAKQLGLKAAEVAIEAAIKSQIPSA